MHTRKEDRKLPHASVSSSSLLSLYLTVMEFFQALRADAKDRMGILHLKYVLSFVTHCYQWN